MKQERKCSAVGVAAIAMAMLVCTVAAHADAVDDYVRGQMESKHIPGVAIAVVKNGKAVKLQGYGVANLELNVPVTADTVFRIGSVSKQIIAAAIVLLANDGKLSLDDKAVKYLDGAPESWSDITIRHLLTHTSGLVREGAGFSALKVQSDAELIKSAYATPLTFKTGERWQYSNLGYFILAEIVRKASGKPWPEFVEERIFAPLAMNASSVVDINAVIPHRADGYVYRNGQYQNAATLLALRPSGAFMSSVNDMLKWSAALDNATLLPRSTLDAMWTPVTLNDGKTYPYGLGFQVEKYGSHVAIGHGGSLTGFRSWYMRLPEEKLSVIVLTNNETAPTDAIAIGIATRYVKNLFPEHDMVRLSAAELEALAGTYKLPNGGQFTFAKEGERLRFKAPNAGIDALFSSSSATKFHSEEDPRMHVEFEASAAPTRVKIFVNGIEQGSGVKQ